MSKVKIQPGKIKKTEEDIQYLGKIGNLLGIENKEDKSESLVIAEKKFQKMIDEYRNLVLGNIQLVPKEIEIVTHSINTLPVENEVKEVPKKKGIDIEKILGKISIQSDDKYLEKSAETLAKYANVDNMIKIKQLEQENAELKTKYEALEKEKQLHDIYMENKGDIPQTWTLTQKLNKMMEHTGKLKQDKLALKKEIEKEKQNYKNHEIISKELSESRECNQALYKTQCDLIGEIPNADPNISSTSGWYNKLTDVQKNFLPY